MIKHTHVRIATCGLCLFISAVFLCKVDYGDGQTSTEEFELKTIPLAHTHNYLTDLPDVLFSAVCSNHFTNISIEENIILRQEIRGLAIIPIPEYNRVQSTVTFNTSVKNGSHVKYSVKFGDGIVNNFTDVDRLSYISPYQVCHIYEQYGNYTVSIFAWNEHFSANVSHPITIHWMCAVPQIIVGSSYTSITSPLQIRKSKSVIIKPECVINCTSSAIYNTSWTISTFNGDALLTFCENDSLFLKPKSLDYGVYEIKCSVSMYSFLTLPVADERVSTLTMYIEITKSPLKVYIEHGQEYGCKYNSSYTIEAESLSYDPDLVDVEDKSGITFRWFCRRMDETFQYLANAQVSTKPYTPPPGTIKHPYLGYGGCFGEGPGIIASYGGSYDFNTVNMIGMTKYVFRVEMFKDVRWGFYEQQFYVGPVDPPLGSIM